MTFSEIRNQSSNEFVDISSEAFRTYHFVNGDLSILGPVGLSVSKSGGHRLVDAGGKCYYVPSSWLAISWEVKENQPHFVK